MKAVIRANKLDETDKAILLYVAKGGCNRKFQRWGHDRIWVPKKLITELNSNTFLIEQWFYRRKMSVVIDLKGLID